MFIRDYAPGDIEPVLAIWLQASITAHNFVDADFWVSKLDDMRHRYLPSARTYVVVEGEDVIAFASMHGDSLAAFFVQPEEQGQGVGSALMGYLQKQNAHMHLAVYKENARSVGFYVRHGFYVVSEQLEEHTRRPELLMHWKAQT